MAALLLIECGHFGVSVLLWSLLAMLALIPVGEDCSLLNGILTYASVSMISLLLPITESAIIFILIGYYPIIRSRINSLQIRTIKAGVRILLVVVVATIMFIIVKMFYGSDLYNMTGTSDSVVLIVFIIAGAFFFILYEFVIDRCTKLYLKHLRHKLFR